MNVARVCDRFSFYMIDGDTTYLHLHNLGIDWRGGKYSPQHPASVVPAATAHKSFGSTDLTSTCSMCTRRVFDGIQAFQSGVRIESNIILYTLCYPEADGPTNLEKPTLNHVQSDTRAFAVLANPTRDLQGTNRGSGPAMEESENDVGSLEQLLLCADEHYLAGKLPLGYHLRKVLHGTHQLNVGPLRVPASQLKWTGYDRL
ncbi:15-hydroxyprostaglandin dehydrogenase [Trichonephila clavipes]|uniref:15-hydroxyprostaglandin dehydrogenase n=1 Tax=Trichonephila clavipes TaxID=2585209 RepID=A0A8X6W788_TRICX|nr:15-hydroxyprostaglandin dehydrogenase [Trichonephila clavipes]